jgi:hypothetical protein
MIITWRTHKTPDGFQFRVYTFGYQTPETDLKTGTSLTRSKAVARAKKWARYFRAQAHINALLQ